MIGTEWIIKNIQKNLKKIKKKKHFFKECAIMVESFLYTCIQCWILNAE